MQIDKIKWAADNAALKVEANGNQQQRGWDTADGTITGNPDQPTLQTTNGWMHAVYKWLEYINGIRTPIGTILTSALSEEQFNSVTSGSWVLCDGSYVGGSQWSALTLNTEAPDLRGYILGGAGSSGITLQETGAPVEDIGLLNQYVEDSVSLRSLSATAEAGDTPFDVGNKDIQVSHVVWSGNTNTLNNPTTRATLGYTRKDLVVSSLHPSSDWVDYPLACLANEESLEFDVNNFQHNHRFTGKLQGGNVVGETKMVTTPVTNKIAYSEPNTEDYSFVPQSIGVNYFLRID